MTGRRSPTRGAIRGTVVAVDDALPDDLRRLLSSRGLTVKTVPSEALRDVSELVVSAEGPTQAPSFTAVLIPVEMLPATAEDARALLAGIADAGAAAVLVGPPRADLEDIADAEDGGAHAWLPTPVAIGPLLTAVRSALTSLSVRAQLESARSLAELKDTEARYLYEVGTALSAERDIDRLQDLILRRCRELTTADAGSVYRVDEDENKQKILRFETSQNDSMPIPFQKFTMPLTDRSIAGFAALTGQTVNLGDVYHLPPDAPYGFNKSFDEQTGYRTKSMLTVPMKNHEGDIIGVIQLINHKPSPETRLVSREIAEREVIPFPPQASEVLDAFAGQAAVALNNQLLLQSIQGLFDGFVKASITAIESRDPTTSGHSERVAELTVGIARAVNEIGVGRWKDTNFTEEQIREIRYAGVLHDFGKIGVREHVLVKAKKLYDTQLEVIRLRFGYYRKAMEVEGLRRQLTLLMEDRDAFLSTMGSLHAELLEKFTRLDEDLAAIKAANEPAVLPADAPERLARIAAQRYIDVEGNERPLLEEPELLALSVKKGSLTDEERLEIESHVSHTYRFLSLMPWTRQFKDLPIIAGTHHERLDGTGYPFKLKGEEIPLQARMMAISDIYDALTAADRPYKPAVAVDRALDILRSEAAANHIDADLLDIFINKRVFDIAVAVTMNQAKQAAALAGSRV